MAKKPRNTYQDRKGQEEELGLRRGPGGRPKPKSKRPKGAKVMSPRSKAYWAKRGVKVNGG